MTQGGAVTLGQLPDPAHVVLGFAVGRHATVAVDRTFASVVAGCGKGQVAIEAFQQPRKILHAATDVLPGVIGIAYAEARGGRRHQLHQALRAGMGQGQRVVGRLGVHDRADHRLFHAEFARRGWEVFGWRTALSVAIASLVILFLQPLPGFLWLGSRPLVWLGELSYGIYLWHLVVQSTLHRLLPDMFVTAIGSFVALLICLAITLALAMMSYYWLERPILDRFARRPRAEGDVEVVLSRNAARRGRHLERRLDHAPQGVLGHGFVVHLIVGRRRVGHESLAAERAAQGSLSPPPRKGAGTGRWTG